MSTFLDDTLRGLRSTPKFLDSKYFYNEAGDKIFQEIMFCPEYYLTRCELEIFTEQSGAISRALTSYLNGFDVIELGPGDALKSRFLLKQLMDDNLHDFTFYPVDISANVITNLHKTLPEFIPGINIHGLTGEYFSEMKKAVAHSPKNKVVLFLGSNIGNMPPGRMEPFCRLFRSQLSTGDVVLIGFDLKKDPHVILDAYNDKAGITKRLNLNLLKRINEELDADFNLGYFEHYPVYDPGTGTCRSYLISIKEQHVRIGKEIIPFNTYEEIHMETSHKFLVSQTDELAAASGFTPLHHFFDRKKYFMDAIWVCA